MLGPEVTHLTGRLAPRTTDPTTQHPHMRRVMCPRDRYIEHPPSMKAKAMAMAVDQCIRRAQPTLTVLYACGGTSAAAARPCALQQPGALRLQSIPWSVGIL